MQVFRSASVLDDGLSRLVDVDRDASGHIGEARGSPLPMRRGVAVTRPLGAVRSAAHLVRQAKKRVHRPPKQERPRCGKATPRGPCQAAAWWPVGAAEPRKRCRAHCRDK